MSDYRHKYIESKWQKYWKDNKIFKTDAYSKKKNFMH